jgi:F420-non-reducing hydrogenase iron-sulfur subunit
MLGEIGLEPERVEMFNMSAAMAAEFVRAATEMTERIAEMGPNPLRVGDAGSGGD